MSWPAVLRRAGHDGAWRAWRTARHRPGRDRIERRRDPDAPGRRSKTALPRVGRVVSVARARRGAAASDRGECGRSVGRWRESGRAKAPASRPWGTRRPGRRNDEVGAPHSPPVREAPGARELPAHLLESRARLTGDRRAVSVVRGPAPTRCRRGAHGTPRSEGDLPRQQGATAGAAVTARTKAGGQVPRATAAATVSAQALTNKTSGWTRWTPGARVTETPGCEPAFGESGRRFPRRTVQAAHSRPADAHAHRLALPMTGQPPRGAHHQRHHGHRAVLRRAPRRSRAGRDRELAGLPPRHRDHRQGRRPTRSRGLVTSRAPAFVQRATSKLSLASRDSIEHLAARAGSRWAGACAPVRPSRAPVRAHKNCAVATGDASRRRPASACAGKHDRAHGRS